MNKTYRSGSHPSFHVSLLDGSTQIVSFSPLTIGGSVFSTPDEELQLAIERHSWFNDVFVLSECWEDNEASRGTGNNDGDSEVDKDGFGTPEVVQVSSKEEAKDYLSRNYDVSRTSMKTTASIKKKAEEFGVVFEGLDE